MLVEDWWSILTTLNAEEGMRIITPETRPIMSKDNTTDSQEALEKRKQFKLGPLGSLNQLLKAGARTLRAMASGEIDSQLGARIMNGIGIMRAIVETSQLQAIERKLDELQTVAIEQRTLTLHAHETGTGSTLIAH